MAMPITHANGVEVEKGGDITRFSPVPIQGGRTASEIIIADRYGDDDAGVRLRPVPIRGASIAETISEDRGE